VIEIWKNIEGYEEIYRVSNFGKVKSLKRISVSQGYQRLIKERILKSVFDGSGYLEVVLCKDKNQKTFLIHRLVAKAFIPNPKNKPQVNHIDKDKANNNVNNLNWMTPKENVNHVGVAGIVYIVIMCCLITQKSIEISKELKDLKTVLEKEKCALEELETTINELKQIGSR